MCETYYVSTLVHLVDDYHIHNKTVLGIHNILVRIRIPWSIPLTNGSGSGSNSGSDSFLQWYKNKFFFFILFLITCPQTHHLQPKKCIFLLKFCVKMLFSRHYFKVRLTHLWEKGRIRIRVAEEVPWFEPAPWKVLKLLKTVL